MRFRGTLICRKAKKNNLFVNLNTNLQKNFPTSHVKNEPMLSPERATVQSLIDAYPHISEKEPQEDDNTKLQSLLDVCNDMVSESSACYYVHASAHLDSQITYRFPDNLYLYIYSACVFTVYII